MKSKGGGAAYEEEEEEEEKLDANCIGEEAEGDPTGEASKGESTEEEEEVEGVAPGTDPAAHVPRRGVKDELCASVREARAPAAMVGEETACARVRGETAALLPLLLKPSVAPGLLIVVVGAVGLVSTDEEVEGE